MKSATDTQPDYYQFEDINNAILRLLPKTDQREPKASTMLDLGCGRGRLGLEVERLGYRVTGIDINAAACASARQRISEVIEEDLTKIEAVAAALAGRTFDWLMAADVLEHSPDPKTLLTFYRHFLKPDGRLIVSLPNVAVWDNRLRLLVGRFNYSDSGVMDPGHLRFFTFRTARELISAAGFTPVRTSWEPGLARAFLPAAKRYLWRNSDPGAILDSRLYRFYSRYLLRPERAVCAIAPRLFAFRIVILARL